jgi:glutamate---cysteine ligase / carboxylate-amine ligase
VDELGSREALKTITEILEQGTGADRQLEIFHRNESLTEVVDYVVHETMRGVTTPVGA